MLLVLALALYVLPREYNAPQSVLFGLLDLFVVTFASLVLTFFTGALLYDYGVERTQAEKARLVARLLETELAGLLDLLDDANAVEVRFTGDGGTGTVVPSRLEPLILTDATREGFFGPEGSARAMKMLGNVAARRVLCSSPRCSPTTPRSRAPSSGASRACAGRSSGTSPRSGTSSPAAHRFFRRMCPSWRLEDCKKWYDVGVVAAPRVGGKGPMD